MRLQLPTRTASRIVDRTQYRVEIKQRWTDEAWLPFDYLQVLQIDDAVAPTIPRMRCLWRSGDITREDGDGPETVNGADFAGYFVRVFTLGMNKGDGETCKFVGRFGSDDRAIGGADAPLADQSLVVYGLGHELDRKDIRSTWVEVGSVAAEIDADVAFNERYDLGFNEAGNRSHGVYDVNGRNVYVFGAHGEFPHEPSAAWTAREIVEHLLAFHAPADLGVTLGGQVEAMGALEAERLSVCGKTVWSALCTLIDRRRGVGWYLAYDPATEKVELRLFSINAEDVTVGDAVVPANKLIVDLDLSNTLPTLTEVSVGVDYTARVGRIVVSGELLLVTGSYSVADGSLEPHWKDEDRLAYDAGPTGTTAADAIDAFRAEDRFDPVYTALRVPAAFGFFGRGGENAGPAVNLNPLLTPAGDVDLGRQGVIRDWGLLACRELPFRKEPTADEPNPDYKKAFAVLRDDAEAGSRWLLAEGVSGVGSVRPLENALGVQVCTTGGKNHLLGKNHFAGVAAGTEPKYDYATAIVTMAVRTDQRLKVVVDVPGGDPTRVLDIVVRGAELHHVAEGTVVGVTADGRLERYAGEPFPRDDRPRLRQIAAQAKAWYGREHHPATIAASQIHHGGQLGTILRRIKRPDGTTEVNSVISSVSYDFSSPQRTTVHTDFAELDLAGAGASRKNMVR